MALDHFGNPKGFPSSVLGIREKTKYIFFINCNIVVGSSSSKVKTYFLKSCMVRLRKLI